jgi:hypothetical protein
MPPAADRLLLPRLRALPVEAVVRQKGSSSLPKISHRKGTDAVPFVVVFRKTLPRPLENVLPCASAILERTLVAEVAW